ncbi:pyridoxamine 5'-phosphate oxidase family protein [Rhodobacteraceae bacterium HTCC2083]|jgi:PPOX class probable FMN-dependent enzyme|nr:pyridoxamine 5'-phosphate oxidase family protein [Rhodobacteraceae bacterium HTCC2083]
MNKCKAHAVETDMTPIKTLAELEAIYGKPVPRSIEKVVTTMTPHYRAWIEASRFVVISTVGPEGTDASPRGDDNSVVEILDDQTVLLPDWFGNNRIDSLRNIVRDERVSLMFMIPSSTNVVRINGIAIVTTDPATCARFEKKGKLPRSVVVMSIGEMYFQCAKALMRSGLWQGLGSDTKVPTAGDFVKERDALFDGKAYDDGYAEYAKPRMW